MPRSVTTAFGNAVAAGDVRPALLFEGLFDGGALRFWTGIGELSWNAHTWYGSGSLIGLEPVEEAAGTKSIGTRVVLTGVDATIISLALAEPYQGRVVNVYFAPLNSSGAVIADPDLLFSGRADVMQIDDTGATATIGISVESMLIDVQRPRPRRYEPQDQKLYYPTDKGFDYVPTLQDKVIKWQ
mgnify:FL=1